jgi:hypothetical protein
MSPEQKLKHLILIRHAGFSFNDFELPAVIDESNVDEIYEDTEDDNGSGWGLQDAREEVRCSGIETGLPAPLSRHYESDAVAAKYVDGSWVGFTYWHGGGKHGEPEAIDWIEDAYDVACAEEEKLVVVRTFTKPESA